MRAATHPKRKHIMKTLSVRQPAANEIASGRKRTEDRTWRTSYRGPLLIAASKKKCGDLPVGCAICLVDLVDITGVEGNYHWHLDNVRLVENTPIKGKLNLYETPDDDIVVIGKVKTNDVAPKQKVYQQVDRPQRKRIVVRGGGASAIRKRKNPRS